MRLSSNPLLPAVCASAAIILLAFAAHAQIKRAGDMAAANRAQRGENPPYPYGLAEGRLMTEAAEDLGLTGKTLDAIKDLSDEQRAVEATNSETYGEAWKKINALLDENLPSEEAIMQLSKQLGDLVTKGRNLKLSYTRNVRALLTAEQLESYMVRRKYVPVPRSGSRRR